MEAKKQGRQQAKRRRMGGEKNQSMVLAENKDLLEVSMRQVDEGFVNNE
jgi:hypothetical protein